MTTRITMKPRGPLIVEGDVELYDERERRIDLEGKKKLALCRCGHSGKRPLCDGAHNRCGFDAPAKRLTGVDRSVGGGAGSVAEPRRRRAGDRLGPDPELWRALDDGRKLRVILEDFYTRVFRDPRLSSFFEGVTKDRAIEKQYNFLREKFTGEKCYFGDRPRNAHHWMVISDELFDYREALMESCLRRAGLADDLIDRWRAVEEIFRKQIVKQAPFGKKVRGVELPFQGFESLEMALDFVCDGCGAEVTAGQSVHYHRRTGRTYCVGCVPDARRDEEPAIRCP